MGIWAFHRNMGGTPIDRSLYGFMENPSYFSWSFPYRMGPPSDVNVGL